MEEREWRAPSGEASSSTSMHPPTPHRRHQRLRILPYALLLPALIAQLPITGAASVSWGWGGTSIQPEEQQQQPRIEQALDPPYVSDAPPPDLEQGGEVVRSQRYVREDGVVVRAAQQGGGGSGQSVSRAGPLIVDTVIAAPPNAPDPLPVIVGHLASHASRWDQMMSWLPSFIEAIGGVLYRVNCTAETDAIQGVIDCHTLVGAAAIRHYEQRGGGNNATGAYIDLEDNCKPSQRADYSLLPQLVSTLMEHPEWYFLHLSRFPAPIGLVDPHVCEQTPLYRYGDNVYHKLIGTCELAQAMLCHTDHARRINDPSYHFVAAYDDNFAREMTHVVYPSIFQRRTESTHPRLALSHSRTHALSLPLSLTLLHHPHHPQPGETSTTATPFFSRGIGVALRDVCFTPWVYTLIDFTNAHAGWFTCLLLPVIIIACLTGDLAIAACCFVAGFIVCWSLGFR